VTSANFPAPQEILRIERYAADVQPVAAFLSYLERSRSIPSLYSARYFDWKISRNPFGPAAAYLRFRGESPAALCSITAKPVNAGLTGRALAELGDTHTHPSFQRQGHFGVLGRHVIEEYDRASGGAALLYGLPNDQALPGWTRHCGCEVFDRMAVRERWLMPAGRLVHYGRALSGRSPLELRAVTDPQHGASVIDEIWRAAPQPTLILKDSAWWKWRYVDTVEPYRTHVAYEHGSVVGWCVARRSRSRVPGRGHVWICDVVATTPETEVRMLSALVTAAAGPLDTTIVWTQAGTALDDAAARLGFVTRRDVPVFFAVNEPYRRLKAVAAPLRLSLGDTDNA
jgi:hypothetical protein